MTIRKDNIIGWEEALRNQPEAYQKWFVQERAYILRNIRKGASVLEIGCGNGRSMLDVLEVTDNLVGLDNDQTAIEHAREALGNYPSVRFVLADAKDMPLKDREFDYVTCIGTFANFGDDKYAVLSEARRVMKDDGALVISVYSDKALDERMKLYRSLDFDIKEVRPNGTVVFNDPHTEGVSEQFSDEQLREIAQKSGFRVKDIEDAGIGYICTFVKE